MLCTTQLVSPVTVLCTGGPLRLRQASLLLVAAVLAAAVHAGEAQAAPLCILRVCLRRARRQRAIDAAPLCSLRVCIRSVRRRHLPDDAAHGIPRSGGGAAMECRRALALSARVARVFRSRSPRSRNALASSTRVVGQHDVERAVRYQSAA